MPYCLLFSPSPNVLSVNSFLATIARQLRGFKRCVVFPDGSSLGAAEDSSKPRACPFFYGSRWYRACHSRIAR